MQMILVTDVVKAKSMLKHTKKQLKVLEKLSVFERGHQDNEDLVKLRFKKKQLESAIRKFKSGELKPLEQTKEAPIHHLDNGEYF